MFPFAPSPPPGFMIGVLAALPAIWLIAAAALVGLVIGSFLNVVIHRLPTMMMREEANYIADLRDSPLPYPDRYNLLLPRSACTRCATPLSPKDNIPVFSYLWLRGKCRSCGTRIRLRYPLTELLCALLTAAAFAYFGPSWHALAASVILWFLLALTLIDADTQLLPDQLTLPLLWLGLLSNFANLFCSLQDAVLGAAIGYLFLWSIYWLFKLLRGKEGMGYGDFKLMAALGAWFGWQALPALILLSSVTGTLFALAMMACGKQSQDTPFAFGPFIASAGVIVLFGSPTLRILPV